MKLSEWDTSSSFPVPWLLTIITFLSSFKPDLHLTLFFQKKMFGTPTTFGLGAYTPETMSWEVGSYLTAEEGS